MGTGLVPLIMFSGMLHQKLIIISASSLPVNSSVSPSHRGLIESCELGVHPRRPLPPHSLQTLMYILLPPNLLKCHEVSKHVSFSFWSQRLWYGFFLSHSHLRSSRSPGFHALGSLRWMQTFDSRRRSMSFTEPFHPAIKPAMCVLFPPFCRRGTEMWRSWILEDVRWKTQNLLGLAWS